MAIELLTPRPRIVVPKLSSYVKLDMAFGVGAGTTLYDKSRYRSHGAITGASWATGLHGKCLDFDSTIPSYVEIPASYTQLDFTSESFSIIARVYIDSLTTGGIILCRGRLSFDGWFFWIHSAGVLRMNTAQLNANQYSGTADGIITTGAWVTLGMSRAGAAVRLYKNGVDITTVFGSHKNPTTSTRVARIGIYDTLASYISDGKVEFLRIFGGVALSTSEHLAYHNALA